MIRVALRGVREHLVRFSLSVLAVTLGVAFVVGTFAFRGMLAATFDAIITTSVNAAVYVRGAEAVATDLANPGAAPTSPVGFGAQRSPVAAALADDVAAVDGVQRVVPDYSGPVVLVGADGTAVVTSGPPSLAFAIDPEYPTAHLTTGEWPGEGQIVLETGAVRASGLRTGDATTVVIGDSPRQVTVSGTFAIDASAAGAVLVGVDAATARAVFAPDGQVPQLSVYADPGVDEATLAARVAAALPAGSGAQAVTGETVRAESRASIQEVLGFLQTFLLIFAAIALVVGAFIITNAFAMAVRERQRENALLRAVGASPAQVFASVLVQAFAVGLVGAALGVGGGVGLVHGIRAVLARFGMQLGSDVPLSAGEVAVAVTLGTVLCLVAAALPARRAALVPPVQAMRDDVAPSAARVPARWPGRCWRSPAAGRWCSPRGSAPRSTPA
ncbi:FtsX-like permease family protein [Xylanimonas allomyrinae]|uniref:FtsX-like permease family protein n=1 Tax=Xylanimonas allomyrinae TaxID=2509459 RepID=UPI001FED0A0F|nr:FtsX-like permease family protein [Xylanimonas allomyrinae]